MLFCLYKIVIKLSLLIHPKKSGFSLKDASSYNVQFIGSELKFIDTLSFEPYKEGEPWVAYRQFCQHFLAPLALMAYVDIDLAKLLSNYIDGIPLSLANKILPIRTRLNYGLQLHLHLQVAGFVPGETGQREEVPVEHLRDPVRRVLVADGFGHRRLSIRDGGKGNPCQCLWLRHHFC